MRPALALATLVLLAGCITPFAERLRAGDVEEPRWQVGDWWTYTVASETTDLAGNVTVVVAEAHDQGYILAVPEADEMPYAALLYHMPAIGTIGSNLSWPVHGVRFEPARWPLSEGLAWETTWISAPVHLEVHANGSRWHINNTGREDSGMRYELVYDPAAKWFSSFVRTAPDGRIAQSLELVANGTGYNGSLWAPRSIEVPLLESRTSGSLSGGSPAAPNPTFTSPAGRDTLLVACLAGGAPGQYHAEVRMGSGVLCQVDVTLQPGDTGTRAQVVDVPAGEGSYEARLLAVGPGRATAEVLAWETATYSAPGILANATG